jgi:DNA mismatch repair protein MutS
VVRLVTPGTLTEDTLLDAGATTISLAVARARAPPRRGADAFALAWIDISTGEFRVAERDRAGLPPRSPGSSRRDRRLRRALFATPNWPRSGARSPAVTPLARDVFDGATAERRLADYFAVATTDGFGALRRGSNCRAAAACVTYVERTQLGKRPPLSPPVREAPATLAIDAATRANLELMRTLAASGAARCSPPSTAP